MSDDLKLMSEESTSANRQSWRAESRRLTRFVDRRLSIDNSSFINSRSPFIDVPLSLT